MPEPDGEADPVPIERFYDLTLVSDLSLSPDGERVAFVVEESERGADNADSPSVSSLPTGRARPAGSHVRRTHTPHSGVPTVLD
jgi:dipeptidyl aminopeptidase/acylaminoacyl peptidase